MQFIEILKTIVLGIIRGITEWLPISSTGHMIFGRHLFTTQPAQRLYGYVLCGHPARLHPGGGGSLLQQAQSFCTVQIARRALLHLPAVGKGAGRCTAGRRHRPAGRRLGHRAFYTPVVIAIALIFYGILFILLERRNRTAKPRIRSFEQLNWRTALCIGFLQLLAIIPRHLPLRLHNLGAMLLSCSRFVATEFSFFMAVPVMFGASGYKILKFVLKTGLASITGFQWGLLLLGSVVSFVVSLFAIKFLMNYIRKHDFTAFGWYRIVLGAIVLLYFGIFA